ncbi:LysR substrate-binding domain-containing protein [Evansella sp. AB-rgal1]|uniref:LysR substrate-binding domain-containing protein n=1 Tax=Evansella sp. AB-rgal1 TaxID=3242696 RepID=UPI00359E90A5
MNLQQLDIFSRFAKEKSITKVAKELNLKQPTVSFHLKKLEESMGVSLYERMGDQVKLTSAGVTLKLYASDILGLVMETKRVMNDYQSFSRGELLIGASNIPANYFLPPVLSEFTSKHPSIHLSMQVHSAPYIQRMIKEKELDLGIVSEQELLDPVLTIKRLIKDDVVFILPREHPYVEKELTERDIEKIPLILHKHGSTRDMINNWIKKRGLQMNVKMELTNIEAIRRMVTLGSGGSILSKRAVEQDILSGTLVAKEIPNFKQDRYLSLIYRKDRPITPILQQFITEIYRL